MPNNQLRWHLLKEVSEMVLRKLKYRRIPPPSPCPNLNKCRWLRPILNLLMSGKGPAKALQVSLPRGVTLTENGENECCVELNLKDLPHIIGPVFFQKLLLRWAHVLYVDCNRVIPEYLAILREYDSIEELRFDGYAGSLKPVIDIIHACPNLSVLNGDPEFMSLLLQRRKVKLSNLHCIRMNVEVDEDDQNYIKECRLVFGTLSKHPERFPNFESLTILADNGLLNLSKCMSRNKIRTLKSVEIDVSGECRPADFSVVASIPTFFPNIEKVCLCYTAKYINAKSMKPVQMFEDVECRFDFKFIYNLDFDPYCGSKKEARKHHKTIKAVMAEYGMNDSVVKEGQCVKYAATRSYPNKTMEFKLKDMARFVREPFSLLPPDSDGASSSSHASS